MPLVHGYSHIRWHLPHSIHGEHRGRTPKCPIANHRVEYNYGKIVPVRIAIDKANSLSDCPIEFEVVQEFPSAAAGAAGGGGREERITLGKLTLNLAEYVEESEAFIRDTGYRVKGPSFSSGAASAGSGPGGANTGSQQPHARKRSSLSVHTPVNPADPASSPKSTHNSTPKTDARKSSDAPAPAPPPALEDPVEEGIIRRYLMSDSKINSTLKIGILMVQLDGERNFVAPALKTAAVFGGIAGMTSSSSTHPAAEDFGQHFQDGPGPAADPGTLNPTGGAGASSSAANSRDVYELQDMYRRALAASWACQPGELPADECIEDIFQGGDGFNPDGSGGGGEAATGVGERDAAGDATPRRHGHGHSGGPGGRGAAMRSVMRREDSAGSSSTGEGNDFLRLPSGGGGGGSVGNSPKRTQQRRHHARHGSGDSANTTMLRHEGGGGGLGGGHAQHQQQHGGRTLHRRESSKDSASLRSGMAGMRSRSGSLASLAGTIETERGRSGFKSAREVTEWEIRDDMVAWKLPGTAS